MATKQELKVYTPESGLNNLPQLFADIWQGFREGRFLAKQMFVRDLKASVRTSYLGLVWRFIPALVSAALWIFLNNQKVVQIDNTPIVYPAFALCGTIIWSVFTESFNKPFASFGRMKGMMLKLNIPKESFVILSFYEVAFTLLLKLIVLVPALIIMGIYPSWDWLLAFLGIMALIVFGLSLGMWKIITGSMFSDFNQLTGYILQVAMYLSPVIYPIKSSGVIGYLQKLNPVSPFISFIRSAFGHYAFEMHNLLWLWTLVGILLFIPGIIAVRVSTSAILERS